MAGQELRGEVEWGAADCVAHAVADCGPTEVADFGNDLRVTMRMYVLHDDVLGFEVTVDYVEAVHVL